MIAFVLINMQTRKAPQNDQLILSFVKDTYVVSKKMTRNGLKMDIYDTKKFKNVFFKTVKIQTRKHSCFMS